MAITSLTSGAGTQDAGSGNIASIPLPTGHTTGDILIAFVAQADNVVSTITAGWTSLFASNNTTALRYQAWWISDTGALSAPTITHAAGNSAVAQIFGFRGAAINPVVGSNNTGTFSGATATITALGVTPAAGTSALIMMAASGEPNGTGGGGANNYATWSGSNPTLSTELGDSAAFNGPAEATLGAAWGLSNTGAATGNRTVALSNVDATAGTNAWQAVFVELLDGSAAGASRPQAPIIPFMH